MKLRLGFVSNSSSCSFTLSPKGEVERAFLRNINEHAANATNDEDAYGWSVTEANGVFSFYTIIENFDMLGYVERLGFEPQNVDHD